MPQTLTEQAYEDLVKRRQRPRPDRNPYYGEGLLFDRPMRPSMTIADEAGERAAQAVEFPMRQEAGEARRAKAVQDIRNAPTPRWAYDLDVSPQFEAGRDALATAADLFLPGPDPIDYLGGGVVGSVKKAARSPFSDLARKEAGRGGGYFSRTMAWLGDAARDASRAPRSATPEEYFSRLEAEAAKGVISPHEVRLLRENWASRADRPLDEPIEIGQFVGEADVLLPSIEDGRGYAAYVGDYNDSVFREAEELAADNAPDIDGLLDDAARELVTDISDRWYGLRADLRPDSDEIMDLISAGAISEDEAGLAAELWSQWADQRSLRHQPVGSFFRDEDGTLVFADDELDAARRLGLDDYDLIGEVPTADPEDFLDEAEEGVLSSPEMHGLPPHIQYTPAGWRGLSGDTEWWDVRESPLYVRGTEAEGFGGHYDEGGPGGVVAHWRGGTSPDRRELIVAELQSDIANAYRKTAQGRRLDLAIDAVLEDENQRYPGLAEAGSRLLWAGQEDGPLAGHSYSIRQLLGGDTIARSGLSGEIANDPSKTDAFINEAMAAVFDLPPSFRPRAVSQIASVLQEAVWKTPHSGHASAVEMSEKADDLRRWAATGGESGSARRAYLDMLLPEGVDPKDLDAKALDLTGREYPWQPWRDGNRWMTLAARDAVKTAIEENRDAISLFGPDQANFVGLPLSSDTYRTRAVKAIEDELRRLDPTIRVERPYLRTYIAGPDESPEALGIPAPDDSSVWDPDALKWIPREVADARETTRGMVSGDNRGRYRWKITPEAREAAERLGWPLLSLLPAAIAFRREQRE